MSELQPPTVPEPATTQTFSSRTERQLPASDLGILPEVPGYTIIRMVGRGGMGIVYEGRDQQLLRTVALKMILLGPHASEKDKKRFRQEAEAVAQLQHPGIVQIYEIGESPTGPFLALEYVGGGSLAEKLDGKPWLPLAAAELVEHVTRAVEAAHQAGIIHRDLKPANILLQTASNRPSPHDSGPQVASDATVNDSLPPSSSRISVPESKTPKITDFGLAKRLDSAQGQTASGAILGTPSYMAPEQAEGRSSTIGPATDVYALGAILYELLTGRPPFIAETAFDTIMLVSRQEAVPPSRLNPKIPADLETICLKCLRKEKDRRYLSATALAEDLRCFREGRPIAARPVNAVERGWRWCRRNPMVAGLLAMVALLLIAGTSIATYFAVEANQQWKDAQAQGELAKRNAANAQKNADEASVAHREADRLLYAARINLAQNALRENRLTRLRELLQETTPAEGAEDHRGWEWHYLQRQANMERGRQTWGEGCIVVPGTVVFAPDVKRCAAIVVSARSDGGHVAHLVVNDIATEKRIFETPQTMAQLSPVIAFSSDGALLAETTPGKIRIWNVNQRSAIHEFPQAKGANITALAFDHAAKRLAIASGTSIRIVEMAGNKTERTIPAGNGAFVYRMAFNNKDARFFFGVTRPNGANYDSEVLFADLPDGKVNPTSGPIAREPFAPFAINGAGQTLAISQGKKRVLIWDHRKAEPLHVVPIVSESIASIAFVSPQMFAVGSASGLVSTYHTNGADEPTILRGHSSPVLGLATIGGSYFSVDTDGEIREWDKRRADRQRLLAQTVDSFGMTAHPTFGKSGNTLVGLGGNPVRSLYSWALADRMLRAAGEHPIGRGGIGLVQGITALSGDERTAAAVLVKQESADFFGNAAGMLPGLAMRMGGPGPFPRALLDMGARVLVSDTEIVRVIDLTPDRRELPTVKLPEVVHQMLLSADGRFLFSAGAGWRIHDTSSGKAVVGDEKRKGSLAIAAAHPDGQRLAIATSRAFGNNAKPAEQRRAAIALRNFDGKNEVVLPLLEDEDNCTITQVQFSPNGEFLAAVAFENGESRSADGMLAFRLLFWRHQDANDYKRAAVPSEGRFRAFLNENIGLAFNEANDRAACVFRTRKQSAEVRVWKVDADQFDSALRIQSGMVEFAGFANDGRRLLVASGTAGGSETHTAELHVFDLGANQELLEIPLGQVIGAQPGETAAWHFDGHTLSIAANNERGGELRIVDGSPVK